MAERDIVQNLIRQLGQSQDERAPAALDPRYAEFDERSTEELLRFARRVAELVRFHVPDPATGGTQVAGDCTPLLPDTGPSLEAWRAANAGTVPPHLALYLAFLELYRIPQEMANGITGRHLDFYYERVLRLARKPPAPDHAHLLVELKRGVPPVAIGPETRFSADKDARGVEQLYVPVRETVVNGARVESLRSIFVDRAGRGPVRAAPIADSADGLGAPLPRAEPKWRAFGHPLLPLAEIGFAVASPVLRMSAGDRTVTLRLRVGGAGAAGLTAAALDGAFTIYLTGEKGWIEPVAARVTQAGGAVLEWELTLAHDAPAVVDYAPKLHGYNYAAQAPIVQLLLRGEGARVDYADLASVEVQTASVSVEVRNVTALTLESDAGTIDSKKAFLPFGPQPTAGSRFMVSYPEALSKKLSELRLSIQWKDAPTSFATHYMSYDRPHESPVTNATFTASVAFVDGGGTRVAQSGVRLFETGNAQLPRELVFGSGTSTTSAAAASGASATTGASTAFRASPGSTVQALHAAGASWSLREAQRTVLASPVLLTVLQSLLPAAPLREGFVTISLDQGFLQAEYRKKYVEYVVKYARDGGELVVLNEPYTPTVRSLALAYRAHSDEVAVSSTSLADFAHPDVQFFHVAPFGTMREHGYQRARFPFVVSTQVPLLPVFPHAGELLIGLAELAPGDSVSLLFQVAAGSADPTLPRETVQWSVLCDGYWQPLGAEALALDTTNGLLRSGIATVLVPTGATTTNTLLPAGRVWLRLGVASAVDAVSQLLAVQANAVEVRFVDRGNDPAHLERPLPPGAITKLRDGVAAVKQVTQPYASFGGSPAERGGAFHTRVAERLRHKDRCVTPWDYERVVLEAFPEIHRVKCIPHAGGQGAWRAPGHVLVVLVPDLRNRHNAADPLQPRADADTLARVEAHLRARAGMQVQLHVENPRYQKIRLDCKVRFRPGFEFNHYRRTLEGDIIRALSPWAYEDGHDLTFGGTIYKSVLLDFVEERPYVDYVTDVRMRSFTDDLAGAADVAEARPATPDAILVSDVGHGIDQAP